MECQDTDTHGVGAVARKEPSSTCAFILPATTATALLRCRFCVSGWMLPDTEQQAYVLVCIEYVSVYRTPTGTGPTRSARPHSAAKSACTFLAPNLSVCHMPSLLPDGVDKTRNQITKKREECIAASFVSTLSPLTYVGR